jgi:agmatine deiminase
MIPDWEANSVFFSALLPRALPAFWGRLQAILAAYGIRPRLVGGTRDIWVRDFLPVQSAKGRFAKFRYAPEYLRGFDHLRTPDEVCSRLPFLRGLRFSPLRLDGGNLVASRRLAIVTDRIFQLNRGRSQAAVCDMLCDLLEVPRCLVIPPEPGDLFGHADGVVRFLDETSVVINDYRREDPGYGGRLHATLAGAGLHVEVLPYRPGGTARNGVPSAVGNYTNFVRVGRFVVVPAYDLPEDDVARCRLQTLLPEAQVVSLPSRDLARRGGVLHCISWTIRLPGAARDLREVDGSIPIKRCRSPSTRY